MDYPGLFAFRSRAIGHLAFFFKSPVSCEVHDLAEQHALLCRHVKGS